MDTVARQAPVSKATLYAHFASKEELFTAVVINEADRIVGEVWSITLDSGDVADVLRRIAQKFVDIFLTEHAMYMQRAVIGVVPRFPAVGVAIFEAVPKTLTERLAQILPEAHERGELNVPNPMLASIQFFSIVRGDLDIRGLLVPAAPLPRAAVEAQIEAGIEVFLHFYAR